MLCVDIVIRYIEVDFTLGLPYYVRYIEEFVKSRFAVSRFSSIHFGRDVEYQPCLFSSIIQVIAD